MFTLHKNNLKMIKAAALHHGEIWFHGDGNIYHKKEDSDFRKDFSNDQTGPQTYRVKITSTSKFPETLDQLSDMLMKSKQAEAIERAKPKEIAGISTFSVDLNEEEVTLPPAEPIKPAEVKKEK